MSSVEPEQKTVNAFAFTRYGQIIPVAPPTSEDGNDYFMGELVRFEDALNKSGAEFQDESLILQVDRTPVDYTDADDLKYLGVIVQDEPINHMLYQDVRNELGQQDRTMNINTLAGPMRNLAVLISHDVVAVRMWDVVNDAYASLDDTDVWKDVYVSKTDGAQTGKAGHATVDDQSAVSGIVTIGKVIGVPINDSFWAYILHDPTGAR